MKLMITGVGGFIGSHFLAHFLLNTDWDIVGIDSWNHKGLSERITDSIHYQNNKHRVRIYTHDLNAPISNTLKERIGKVDYIINLASQSHVDRSIIDPEPFIRNNVNVILTMLDYAREAKPKKFIQIGTDESYGPAPTGTEHKEWAAILPSNPYSASKACQEAIAISYWRSYNVPLILTNTMNNFSQMQDSEKFIPKVMKKVAAGETVEIHSDPTLTIPGSRFWLHSRNHADAILFLLRECPVVQYPESEKPERFNVVGEIEINNLEMARYVAKFMGKELKYKMIDAHTQRPGHDARYGLCGDKLKAMGFEFKIGFEDSLKKTVEWTLEHPQWLNL